MDSSKGTPNETHAALKRRIRSGLRVLIVDGHPRADSFGSAIADAMCRAAASRTEEIRSLVLRERQFDPCGQGRALEPDLRAAQHDVLWAQVIVLVYPTWWGTTPALLKGFLDRVLHPGFAFVERSDGGWKGLLTGRAALLVTTMDTPRWIYRWLLGAPGDRAMRDATLGFCGIGPTKIVSFGPVRHSTLIGRRQWLARAAREARRLEVTFHTGWPVKLRAWIAAARLHFYVQPWLAYSMGALAWNAMGGVEWRWTAYLLGYAGIFLIEFITVVSNELADDASARINANASALTGGSRVMVSGRLSSTELRRGRKIAFCLLGGVLICGIFTLPLVWPLLVLGGIGLALGMSYSAPPARLCARGLGEFNVAITHSFLVVLAGFAAQGGTLLTGTPWLMALPLFVAVLPAITLAGFPDFEADEATGKRTLAIRLGRHRAAQFARGCALGAALLPLCVFGPAHPWLWWTALPSIPHALRLDARLRGFIRSGCPAGRIDALLVLALSFMVWFCLVPLIVLIRLR